MTMPHLSPKINLSAITPGAIFKERLDTLEEAVKKYWEATNKKLEEQQQAIAALQNEGSTHAVEASGEKRLSTQSIFYAGTWNGLYAQTVDAADGTPDSPNELRAMIRGVWHFQHSCWDGISFIGDLKLMEVGETAVGSILLAINIVMQVVLVTIVLQSLVRSTVDQEAQEGYHVWRALTGHNIQFLDRLTEESLSSRVCRSDASLYLSGTQSQHVAEINAYLHDNAPFNGPLLCIAALYVWVLTVFIELNAVKDMFGALLGLPRDRTSVEFQRDRTGEGMFELKTISGGRINFIVVFNIIRSIIGFAVLVSGSWFLVVTISLEDIILNTIALDFILSIDEMLFVTMFPTKTKKLIELMKVLRTRKPNTNSGVDLSSLVMLVLSVGFVAVMCGLVMIPHMSDMQTAKDELCAGRQEFGYGSSRVNHIEWFGRPVDLDAMLNKFYTSENYKVLRGIITTEEGANFTDYLMKLRVDKFFGSGTSVQNTQEWSVSLLVSSINSICMDALEEHHPYQHVAEFACYGQTREIFSRGTDLTTLDVKPGELRCGHMLTFCQLSLPPGLQARAFCPLTCGCDDPTPGLLAVQGDWFGCPSSCWQSLSYIERDLQRNCTEPTSVKVYNEMYSVILANVITAAMDSPITVEKSVRDTIGALFAMGCDLVFVPGAYPHICTDDPWVASQTVMCPVSCRCDIATWRRCPPSCKDR
jgi:hypothetical protein